MRRNLAIGLIVTAIVAGMTFRAVALTGSATAEPLPRIFPYQGYIEDADGPINDTRKVTFFITTAPGEGYDETGCNKADKCRWEETQNVEIRDGYFSVKLGDGEVFPDKLFDAGTLFVRVRIADDADGTNYVTLEGAQQLLATPYAITAQVAPNFNVTGSIAAGGDLSVAGGIRAGGTASVPDGDIVATGNVVALGGATIGGALQVGSTNGLFAISDEFVWTNGDLARAMTDVNNSVCFLAEVSIYDNEAKNGRERCTVARFPAKWVLSGEGHDTDPVEAIVCKARCLSWK